MWNGTGYEKDGNITGKFVNGKWIGVVVVEKPREEEVEKKGKGVLYYHYENGKWRWNQTCVGGGCLVYEGEIKNRVPNGLGTVDLPGGGNYVGEFKNGEQNGQGTKTWIDGRQKYVGEWKDGEMNGMGKWTSSSGFSSYDGEWENGTWNGRGIEETFDGGAFLLNVGEFKNGYLWNGESRYTSGEINYRIVNGVKQK